MSIKTVLLSQRESFVTVKIFESKILMNFDVFFFKDPDFTLLLLHDFFIMIEFCKITYGL